MSDVAVAATPAEYAPAVSVPLASSSKAAPTCLNCASSLSGPYCAACGQAAKAGRLTLSAVAGEFASQVVALDHGLLHTIVDLVRRPGPMLRGVFEGRRRTYTGPVTYAALSAALSILLGELSPALKTARLALAQPNAQAAKSFSARQLEAMVSLQQTLSANNLLFIAVLIPPVMLAIRFFLRKYKINLAEAGALACYFLGTTTFVASTLSMPFALRGNAQIEATVFYVFGTIYVVYAAMGLFGRTFAVAWRTVAAFAVGLFSIGIVEVVAIIIAR